VAAESHDPAFFQQREHAAAFRAGERAQLAEGHQVVLERLGALGDLHLAPGLFLLAGRDPRDGRRLFAHQARKQRADLVDRKLVVRLGMRQRIERHRADHGIGGLLDDRRAAAQLDGEQACGAVVERAGEHHADHARAVDIGGGADRRAEAVFLGPLVMRT